MQLIKEKERYNVIESIERLSNAGIYENDILAIDKSYQWLASIIIYTRINIDTNKL